MSDVFEIRVSRLRYVAWMTVLGVVPLATAPYITGGKMVEPAIIAIWTGLIVSVSMVMPLGNRTVRVTNTQLFGPDTKYLWNKPVSVPVGLLDLAASRVVSFGRSYLAIKYGGHIYLDPLLMGRDRCRTLLREIAQRQAVLEG